MSDTPHRSLFIGEQCCIGLVNARTIISNDQHDPLGSFNDLLDWLRDAQVLGADEIDQARSQPISDLAKQRLLKRARHLQEVLRDMLNGITQQASVPDQVISAINALLAKKEGSRQLVKKGKQYVQQFQRVITRPEQLLVPVAEAAADLIALGDWSRLKKCENPPCVLYFYDASKNHTRRWCSMAVCGNRTKAAAHYRRRLGAR